jgi:hypothetical protein
MKQFVAGKFSGEDFVKTCYGLDEFEIEKLDFDQQKLTLKVFAKLPLKKAMCVKCEGTFTELHDWQERTARMPPFGNFLDVTLYLKKPRGHCGNCLKVMPGKIFFSIPSFHPWLVDLQSIVEG